MSTITEQTTSLFLITHPAKWYQNENNHTCNLFVRLNCWRKTAYESDGYRINARESNEKSNNNNIIATWQKRTQRNMSIKYIWNIQIECPLINTFICKPLIFLCSFQCVVRKKNAVRTTIIDYGVQLRNAIEYFNSLTSFPLSLSLARILACSVLYNKTKNSEQ